MMLFSILLPLVLQSAAPVEQPSLVDLQARAAQAHKAYREKTRGPQRCTPQAAAANDLAAKAAAEAIRLRRQLLSDLASRPMESPAAAVDSGGATEEIGKAVLLLTRDLETSAALMAKTNPKYEAPAAREFLSEAATLPQPAALSRPVGSSGQDIKAAAVSILGDLTTEESLLSAYFSSSKLEIERACIEREDPAADPFRVPAKATKRTRGVRK